MHELIILAKLLQNGNWHPNFVPIKGLFHWEEKYNRGDNYVFTIVMEKAKYSLYDLIQNNVNIDREKIWKIMKMAVGALNYLCRIYGIFHRDIKPHNILMDDNENVWIADFGIASVMKE